MSMKLKCCILFLLSAVDGILSTTLLMHGDQWEIFHRSALEYSFQHSFIDLWFWMILRTCVFYGCFFGILANKSEGPEKLKKNMWVSYCVGCMNAYFACAKLLIFSEQPEFVMGPELTWFWMLFAWNFVGIGIFIYQWKSLASLKFGNAYDSFNTVVVDDAERQPLLQGSTITNDSRPINEARHENGARPSRVSHVTFVDDDARRRSASTSSDNSVDSNRRRSKDETENEKAMSELVNKATMKKLFLMVLPDWPIMTLGLFFLIGASVAEIFLPMFTGKVITGIVVSGDRSQFARSLIEMAAISLFASICAGMRAGCFMTSIQRLNIRVRNTLFASITSQEIGFFDEIRTGDITSRLTADTTAMSDTVGLNMNIFLRSSIKAIGVCVFMFVLSWRLSIVTFAGLPLVFVISKVYGKYYKKLQKLVQDRFAYANEVAEEICSSMQTVRSFANEEEEKQRYSDRLHNVYKVQRKQAISYSGYIWSNESFELLLLVFTLWYGGQLLFGGSLTAESFISFVLYQEQFGECFSEMGEVYTGLMQALGAAEKVFELIEREPQIRTTEGTEEPPTIEGRVEFQNVSFAYPTRENQPILKNVSFEVNPGEVVALVGPSGGGKSSCVKLLQRFYDPTSGDVLIDGRPVSSYKHEYLHEKVSLVGQEPVLFARTIAENIAYGLDPSRYTRSDIKKAAVVANAHLFIAELPEKFQTETGEKGTQLSGGQKQRISIARALIRNPRILLLDEATSALDTESEFLVQEALERSKSHRTVMLIAHRLSTVERADRIIVIVKGEIAEQGSHNELMERKGVYYKLVYRQLHGGPDQHVAEDAVDAVEEAEQTRRSAPHVHVPMEIKMLRRRSTMSAVPDLSSSCESSTSVSSTMNLHV